MTQPPSTAAKRKEEAMWSMSRETILGKEKERHPQMKEN